LIPRFGTAHTTIGHARDEGLHIVDHEIDFVFTAILGWMDRDLGRGQREDQPSRSYIDMWEAEHISKKCAIGISIRAVDDHVRSGYLRHSLLHSDTAI
jgi:hypothetical protein